MGLQSSGSISLSNIAGEFGGSTPHSLSEYHDAASGIPASGQISFSNFYGASAVSHWIATIGGTGFDDAQGIAVDGSGNVYIAGRTSSAGAGSYDALIVKYNADGVIQWQRTLGASSTDAGLAIAVDGSGNVYVHGYAFLSSGSADFLTVKYNTSGTLQWQRTLDNSSGVTNAIGYAVSVDNSGNIYVGGGGASGKCLIAKLPADGSMTGTYGSFTYSPSSLISSTVTMYSRNPGSSVSISAGLLTHASSSLTSSASNLTSSTTTL